MALDVTSAAYDQDAFCGGEWCATARENFSILEDRQQAEQGTGLYETTLSGMLLALGVPEEKLTTWYYFFNIDDSGIISVSPPQCPPVHYTIVTVVAA